MIAKKHFSPGEICPESGIYRLVHNINVSHEQSEIPLTKGERFPPCRNCSEPVSWELVYSASHKK